MNIEFLNEQTSLLGIRDCFHSSILILKKTNDFESWIYKMTNKDIKELRIFKTELYLKL